MSPCFPSLQGKVTTSAAMLIGEVGGFAMKSAEDSKNLSLNS